MLNPRNPDPPQTIFQMENQMAEMLKQFKEKIHTICAQYLHKLVRVKTVHGHSLDGVIVHFDHSYVYLQVSTPQSRALPPYPYPPYNPYYSNVILPLALFDLLAIALVV